jgi:hypothetical protein
MAATTLLGIPWFVWGIACLVIAAIYLVIWPRSRGKAVQPRPLWRRVVLRWFHALVWVLLAASCFVLELQVPGTVAAGSALALLAGLMYLIFLGAMVADILAPRR